jgi:hypothetical protein
VIRFWESAWLETSITACEQSLATIRLSQSAITGAGGVVWLDVQTSTESV